MILYTFKTIICLNFNNWGSKRRKGTATWGEYVCKFNLIELRKKEYPSVSLALCRYATSVHSKLTLLSVNTSFAS